MPKPFHPKNLNLADVSEAEDVPCCVCGAPPPGKAEFVVQTQRVVRCPICGLQRVSPRPAPAVLRQVYGADYWKSPDSVLAGYTDYPGDEANIRRTFRRRIKRVAPGHGGGLWLDVGCAYGFLLLEAEQAGYEVQGLEWSEAAAAAAPEAIRGRIRVGSFQQADFPENAWDVISFWDYLEHSPDPKADLLKAYRLLKPGGRLSIVIPDAGSRLARWMGPRWEEFKKPQEHLYFFTGKQLASLCASLGLTPQGREWAGKYARLDFALSRFKRGDGILFPVARAGRFMLKMMGLEACVIYVNPRDKLHLLCQKERA
ncbi:MAG: class I SAM-dependent methyltransferase [Candidatus Firestonebacteria bacterium]|nr:class I SAM-dependent methyltransferase [Candidatus Firestonebacteria bacterium]